jgi:hypothetical protein
LIWRVTLFCVFFCLSAQIGCQSLPHRRNYVGLTKNEVVRELGFPVAIDVLDKKPAAEYWVYYQKSSKGGIEPKYLGFSSNGRVESNYSDINPDAFVSIKNPKERNQILAYRKAWLERDEGGVE